MSGMTKEEAIVGEKIAFDHQIQERIDNGHVPDLRHKDRNEWFYNNVWRDPELVKISFLENISFLNKYLKNGSKILEIGCGPGHNSLEFARNGHYVTGIDLSPKCIELAKKTLVENVYRDGFGSLTYYCGNFLETEVPGGPFDAVFFYGALSHFPDIETVLERVCNLLTPLGKILIYDTGIDVYTEKDAAILYAIKSLLAATGHYYETQALPRNGAELSEGIEKTLADLRYVDDAGTNVQSPNDNSQTYSTMMPALAKKFDEVVFAPESCFFRNMIGGIRFEKREDEHKMASFIKLLDAHLTENKILSTAYFYYVGAKKC
jgi:2-polyprenyl-3-methyl-5-hydroxy-6-metoxy-1,4-benzoquinol methylase